MIDLTPPGLEEFRDALAQARYTDRPEFVRGRNAADALLRLVDAIYRESPSKHGEDFGPAIPDKCRYCAGEAAGLEKVRTLIDNFTTYTDLDEEPPR